MLGRDTNLVRKSMVHSYKIENLCPLRNLMTVIAFVDILSMSWLILRYICF